MDAHGEVTDVSCINYSVVIHSLGIYLSRGLSVFCIICKSACLLKCFQTLICVLGADSDLKNPITGRSALHYGCLEKHMDVVE